MILIVGVDAGLEGGGEPRAELDVEPHTGSWVAWGADHEPVRAWDRVWEPALGTLVRRLDRPALERHATRDYQVTLQVGCFCDPVLVGPTRIVVQDHEIQSAVALTNGMPRARTVFRDIAPIDEQFRIIRAQLEPIPG